MIFEYARREVIATCLELADSGYLAGTGGNVACRIDADHFAVTPSASDYYTMQPEDICVLRLSDFVQVAGERKPSVEHRMHAGVLRARPDCHASIHTHQPIASAYTLIGRDLAICDPVHQRVLGLEALLVSYAPSGTRWLASKLQKTLRPDVNAYLLRNHGVVCCGPTLREAVARVKALESACCNFFREAIRHRPAAHREFSPSDVLNLLCQSEELESVY